MDTFQSAFCFMHMRALSIDAFRFTYISAFIYNICYVYTHMRETERIL